MVPQRITLSVNDAEHVVEVEPRRTLLDVLRNDLGLTGAKHGCGMGNCGACTVLIDGEARLACLMLAIACEGQPITTIEGLGESDALDPLQQAFVEADAFQCGFCTPGQILSVKALLARSPTPTDAEIAHAMSGNLCRCGAYRNIAEAVRNAARRR